jgi:hypothetical protein
MAVKDGLIIKEEDSYWKRSIYLNKLAKQDKNIEIYTTNNIHKRNKKTSSELEKYIWGFLSKK